MFQAVARRPVVFFLNTARQNIKVVSDNLHLRISRESFPLRYSKDVGPPLTHRSGSGWWCRPSSSLHTRSTARAQHGNAVLVCKEM